MMTISKRSYNLAYYKKTPKNEESKVPFTLHNMKSQDYLQMIKKALKSSTLQKLESDTSRIGVDFKRK